MDIFTKNGCIFMVQVDHLTGECIGQTIEAFYASGASNVQVVTSITKKNRPSFIYFIDCRPSFADAIEQCIIDELGTGGWHRIDTTHRHLSNEIIRREIRLLCHHDEFKAEIFGKRFGSGQIRPEHDCVVDLMRQIKEEGKKYLSYGEVYHLVMSALKEPEKDTFKI